MPILAVEVDDTKRSYFRDQNALNAAAIPYAGNLYAFLLNEVDVTFDAYKSTDGGASWSIQDHANAPGGTAGMYYAGSGNLIYCAHVVANGSPQNRIGIKVFDMDADSWSIIATAGPQAQTVNAIWKRPDNSYLVIYDAGSPITPGKLGASRLWFVVWNGSAWVDDTDAAAPASAENLQAYNAASAMDTTGRVHIAVCNFAYSKFYYRGIEADNSLGAFVDWSALGTFSAKYNGLPLGGMCVTDSLIVIGVAVNQLYTAVVIGDDLANPNFTLSSAIDSSNPPTAGPAVMYSAAASAIGMVNRTADVANFISRWIRTGQTNNLASPGEDWQMSNFYDILTDAVPPNCDTSWGIGTFVVDVFSTIGYISANYRASFYNPGMFVGPFTLVGPTPPETPSGIIDAAGLQYIPLPDPRKQC